MGESRTHQEVKILELFGKHRVALDLGRELSPDMPHYPGHMKTTFLVAPAWFTGQPAERGGPAGTAR
jgi:hypothetical protein